MKKILSRHFPILAIFLLAIVIRFWSLGSNPPSLYVDEVSQGYNAYSILKTGRDEYGKLFPLIFRSLETYNPAFPIYSLVPGVAVFGLNEFAVRFPSALLGSLTIILTFLICRKLFANNLVSLSASFFLAISPWHIHFSRFLHEANIMIFFTLLGFLLFLHSVRNYKFLLLSALSFGVAINTFHGAKLWVALFLLLIYYFYKPRLAKLKKKIVFPILILIFFSLPTLMNLEESFVRPKSVSIFEKEDPINLFITGYLSHFSPNFLFLRGDYIGRHSVPGMGQLYVFQLPLIILGLLYLIKKNSLGSKFILFWLLIAPIPAAVALPTPHAARSLSFIPLWSIISAMGLYSIKLYNIKKLLKFTFLGIIASIALYNIVVYLHLYYVHYPKEKALDWSDGNKQMVSYVKSVEKDYDNVAINNYMGNAYIFMLFYSKYDPAKYQLTNGNKKFFANYEFFDGFPQNFSENTLVINIPEEDSIFEIKMNNGDTVFVAKD